MDTQNPTTEPKLSLWQRAMADAPVFWKKVQLAGLILGGITATVATNIPPELLASLKLWLAVAAGISTGMVGLGQLAVKNPTVLENPNASLQDVVDAIPALKQQISDLHGAVVTTVNDALSKGQIDTPAADIPVVNEYTPVTVAEALPATEAALSEPQVDTTTTAFQQAVEAAVAAKLAQQTPPAV